MPFEKPKFEERSATAVDEEEPHSSLEREEELEREVKKLKDALAEIAVGLKKENVPVDDECRLDPDKFIGVYPQEVIKRDLEEAVRIKSGGQGERRQYPRLSWEEIKKKKEKEAGERLEMLKTAVFNKFLGKDFIVVRTCDYDDTRHIDNFIVERKTGVSVCAFDEVAAIRGPKFQEKVKAVKARNHNERGGTMKYGFKLEKGAMGTTKLIRGKVENLPIFLLALPPELIDKATEEMTMPGQEPSGAERRLFGQFMTHLEEQAESLGAEKDLNPELKKRVNDFERIVKRIEF
jgi:hypothetical protein